MESTSSGSGGGSACSVASTSATAGCSCECTCRAGAGSTKTAAVASSSAAPGGSQQRIERLEAQVTSIARQLDGRRHRLTNLRDECRQLRSAQDALRREHETRTSETRRMFVSLSSNVQRILAGWADAGQQTVQMVSSEQRSRIQAELESYRLEGAEVSALLDDVDATTSELRQDVLQHRCRSSSAEVELLALHLSRATQRLASLKNRFPELEARTRNLLRQEADTVACDERHLADEQQRLESWLRRVKKLTMMLYTFKQLAEAQAKESEVAGPRMTAALAECLSKAEDSAEVRRDLLHNIASVCPDHERRVAEINRAEAAIQRRQRMIREAATLKAKKTLTAAASRLKPVQKPTAINPVPQLVFDTDADNE
ncbi:hypothetical protein BOX15_Mlig013273g2 [Macrostomum lignano]|nr:hypothetical protein BOX15_Mlig013273g2 [Macrostomum lignano]